MLWERAHGRPLATRSSGRTGARPRPARALPAELLRERTGLVPDPYFSATKLPGCSSSAAGGAGDGDLAFGTVDSWLIWRLTGGGVHATDVTNASRTLLMVLRTLRLGRRAARALRRRRARCCRRSCPRAGRVGGRAAAAGATVPIAGVAGDQQAALFGQGCLARGQAKATYGTGSFLLVNTGERRARRRTGWCARPPAQRGRAVALEGACSWPGRRCSGCATGSV